jgi:hypothetical protein
MNYLIVRYEFIKALIDLIGLGVQAIRNYTMI